MVHLKSSQQIWGCSPEKVPNQQEQRVERSQVPHTPCFLRKSAESHEKKRVEFLVRAKSRKRVRKKLNTKRTGQKSLAG